MDYTDKRVLYGYFAFITDKWPHFTDIMPISRISAFCTDILRLPRINGRTLRINMPVSRISTFRTDILRLSRINDHTLRIISLFSRIYC